MSTIYLPQIEMKMKIEILVNNYTQALSFHFTGLTLHHAQRIIEFAAQHGWQLSYERDETALWIKELPQSEVYLVYQLIGPKLNVELFEDTSGNLRIHLKELVEAQVQVMIVIAAIYDWTISVKEDRTAMWIKHIPPVQRQLIFLLIDEKDPTDLRDVGGFSV